MKISIARDDLLAVLNQVLGVVERRNTIPILSNVKIEAVDGQLKLTATDMDLEAVAHVDAEIEEDGATTIPAKRLSDIVRLLPAGAVVRMEDGDGRVKVQSGRSRFTLPCRPVADFPLMAGGELPHMFRIASGEMKGLVDRTRFAISTDETRYYLNGICLHESKRNGVAVLRAVATDTHRLASVEVSLPDGAAGMPGVIVPHKTVTELRKLTDESAADVEVALSESMIRFACGAAVLTSKLIDGTYPDYQRVIPVGNGRQLRVDRGDLVSAVSRVAAISGEKTRAINLAIGDGPMVLSARYAGGDALDEVDVEYDGGIMEIGFNAKYLLEVVSHIGGEIILFELSNDLEPAIIRDAGSSAGFCVLMPMRVN